MNLSAAQMFRLKIKLLGGSQFDDVMMSIFLFIRYENLPKRAENILNLGFYGPLRSSWMPFCALLQKNTIFRGETNLVPPQSQCEKKKLEHPSPESDM